MPMTKYLKDSLQVPFFSYIKVISRVKTNRYTILMGLSISLTTRDFFFVRI